MQVTTAQLNEVATLLNTTDKNLVFNTVITTLVKNGVDIVIAFDAVFGEGAYKKFAGEVWKALQK